MMEWITSNWEWILVGYFVLEKVVKISPTKADDITLDIIWSGLKKVVGR
jgi:hypothetical protein